MIKDLFKDISEYLPSMVIPAIVGIAALPIITRLFAPADYGNYILVIATISILSTLASWVGISIVRLYPTYEKNGKNKEFSDQIVKLTFLTILTISALFFGVLFLLHNYNHVSRNLYYLMSVGILIFIVSSLFEVLQSFLRIKRQIKWYSGFFVWRSVTALIFGVMLVIFLHLSIEGLLWGTILSIGLVLPVLWKIAIGKLQIMGKRIYREPTFEMAKYSFPLVVGNIAAWILSLSDRYVLEFFRGAHEVGLYSISYQVSQHGIMMLVSLFTLAFNPLSIIVWEKEGIEASRRFMTQGTRYFLLLCIPAVVGLSVLRGPILNILSTPAYYEGAKIIPLVVLGVFFLGLFQRFMVGLILYKKTYPSTFCIIASGALNLGLNFWLIPEYGYMAAAFTTLISYAFLLFLMVIVSRRYFVWEFPFKSLAKAIGASGVMGAIVYPIGNSLTSSNLINLILAICVGAVVYILILFLLREIKKEEIIALQDIKSKILIKMRQPRANRK